MRANAVGAGMRVAVLGAGMAGAAAAHGLSQAGFGVTVFDKGRQVGGRMATRRGAAAFDHGAQIMRAHAPAFAARLADWRSRGLVAPWGEAGAFVGCPDMTAPVADLLAGLDVRVGAAVTGLAREPEGWRITRAEKEDAGLYDAVILAIPSPQAIRLLGAAVSALPDLATAAYAPCWAVMLTLPQDLAIPDIWRPGAGPIATVFRESSKPRRATTSYRFVVHATPDWSRTHLEEEREAVAAHLAGAFGAALGVRLEPLHLQAHRWRYALVETNLGVPCLDEPVLRLGACGDYCLGPRIEAAFESGTALAARFIADWPGAGRG